MMRHPDQKSTLRVTRTAARCCWLLLVTATVSCPSRLSSAADKNQKASSIQKFVAAKDRWPQLVGRPLQLEGRFTVFSGNEIRFAGCDVRFLSDQKLKRPRGDSTNVEVAGRLAKRNGKYVFLIRELHPRPTDMERLKLDRVVMDTNQPDAFYELAQRTRDRGHFYADEELKQAASDLFESGLTRAYETLAEDDAAGIRDLATKAQEFGLDERLRVRFLHEANRIEFEVAAQQEQPNYAAVASRIARDLSGSRTPLTAAAASLREDYEQAPRVVYRVADDNNRQSLDRLFYAQVLLAGIELDAEDDGRNGYAMANRIEKELPEMPEVAETYREQELAYLNSRVRQMTRQQVVDLAGKYESREQTEQAIDVQRRWLKSRERQAQADGPRGLMELGEEYLNLLQDEKGAARLFRAAYAENPQQIEVSTWLSEHGYVLKEGQWARPGESPMSEDDDLLEAIREGRPQKGMTGSQVRSALGSAPSSVVRIASAGRISEVWHFDDLGISVQLTRRSHQTKLTVQRVTDAP